MIVRNETSPVVRKLLAIDIRCRACNAPPGERCRTILLSNPLGRVGILHDRMHGERLAEHAELERAGWQWQEVDPTDRGAKPRGEE